MRIASVLALVLLAGCAHRPIDPPVDKPVAVSCVATGTPAAPEVHTPQALLKVPDGPTRYVMAAADYQALYAWMLQASPALEGCRNAATP
jgi:hypothetical protein